MWDFTTIGEVRWVLCPQEDVDETMSVRQIMYALKEDLVRNTARLYLPGGQVQIFISLMRKYSNASRYNKVSKKLDDNVRKMLIGLGYYIYGKDTSSKNENVNIDIFDY